MQISKTCAALVLLLVFTGTFCGVNAATKEQKDESPFLNFDAASEIDHKTIEMETALKEGRLEKALNLARQLVELSAKCYGTDHYEYARALNNFAWYEQNNGDFTGARKDFETAQRIIEKELGKDSPKLVAVLNNLATLLAAQGDAQRAAPLLERSLTLEEMVLGKDSVDLSNTLNNLAVIYDACGREQDARNVLERAFQIETKQDCDELEKTMTLTNLALMNQSEGKLEDAEKMLEEVLALRKKNKTSASDLSETLNNLAVIEISQNKLAEAEDHLNEALELLPSAAESGYIDKMPVLNNQCKLQLKKRQTRTCQAGLHQIQPIA